MSGNARKNGTLAQFVHARRNSGAWALIVLVTVAVCTSFLSEGVTAARLLPQQELLGHRPLYGGIWIGATVALLLAIAVLWIANSTGLLRRAVLLTTGLFTAQLCLAVVLIVVRLVQSLKISADTLILDTIIIFSTNVLIFALWYWFIDSATTRSPESPVAERWDFLFPQRQASYPGYAEWTPGFLDYLFLAYTTSVAFSPTDTLPLSRVAKILMITQSAIALIAITAVAGTAINLLAGSG